MTRSRIESWSTARSLAFLAAVFAVVFGSLMPFAALAASTPGHAFVICSAEGPHTVGIADPSDKTPAKGMGGAKCAACVAPMAGALPVPPPPRPTPLVRIAETVVYTPASVSPPPPARAPPRPPSTAPPVA